ncbi:MAG: DUF3710 domain-containing protein [Dermatophilaceae bacterium]
MGIFRRASKGNNDQQDQQDQQATAEPDVASASADHDQPADLSGSVAPDLGPADPGAMKGPLDRAEVDGLDGRLDLGALWIAGVDGMELRLELEQESQNVVGVTAVLGESAVQLQAFAAPRTEGIWSDIRAEIAASITSQGGTADLTTGPLGLELQARMPGQAPDGRTVFSPARFVGIDGPRWFLRAVLSGRAAIDEEAAAVLLEVVRATVVVRGDEAMAPRELLTLKLPEQGADAAPDQDSAEGEPAMAPSTMDDFHPFERGPEITEIH